MARHVLTGAVLLCWIMQASAAQAAGPAAAPDAARESSAPGRKQGNVAGSCISYRATPLREGSHVIETFPGGAKLLATVKSGVLVGYSAVDRRGKALKVTVSRNVPKATPGEALARGRQRAKETREARERSIEEAAARAQGKGCWVIIAVDIEQAGVITSYRSCPKGI
jgi:hypothetical protein